MVNSVFILQPVMDFFEEIQIDLIVQCSADFTRYFRIIHFFVEVRTVWCHLICKIVFLLIKTKIHFWLDSIMFGIPLESGESCWPPAQDWLIYISWCEIFSPIILSLVRLETGPCHLSASLLLDGNIELCTELHKFEIKIMLFVQIWFFPFTPKLNWYKIWF